MEPVSKINEEIVKAGTQAADDKNKSTKESKVNAEKKVKF